jgi:proteic killer suppression protein
MIQSFRCKHTKTLHEGKRVSKWQSCEEAAQDALAVLDAATSLSDLRCVPGNHLEELQRDRKGQYSIRINKKWRICFIWTANGPERVEIVDYH